MRALWIQLAGLGFLLWLVLASVLNAGEPVRPVPRSPRESPPAHLAEGNPATLPLAPPSQPRSAANARLPGRTSAIRVGSRLAIVLGIFATAVIIQRWLSAPRRTSLPSDVIQVCGRVPLNARQRLLLVRVGERMLILLESPQGVGRLAEITDPAEVARLVDRTSAQSMAASPSLAGELLSQMSVREDVRRV
jgi:flagellar biogenesis protein FliO